MNRWGTILLAFIVAACQAQPKIHIVAPRAPISALICMAEIGPHANWMRKHFEITWVENNADVVERMRSGEADLAVTGLSSFLTRAPKEKKYRLIAEVYTGSRNTMLAVRKSMELADTQELKGKSIGYVANSSAEIFLEYFLLTEGLSLGSVEMRALQAESLEEQFMDSSVDAIVIWEPELSRLRKRIPTDPLDEFQSFVHEAKGVLMFQKQMFNKKNNSTIQELFRVLMSEEERGVQHRDELIASLIHCFDEEDKHDDIERLLTGSRAELKLSNSLKQSYNRSREWLILRKGYEYSEMPSFEDVLEEKFLREVRPSAVTLHRGPVY